MRWACLLVFVVAAVVSGEVLPLAQECDVEACKLPNCKCASTDIPGGLAPRDTPQFIHLTFDDDVNAVNFNSYRALVFDRVNSNGCPVGTTFFVHHEYADYQLINELYNRGYEIGLHSITHQSPREYWTEASVEVLAKEFGDQRLQMAHFANIPYDDIKGIRNPYLQLAGNNSFEVIARYNLTYDSSWPAAYMTDPGLWPYTLDYATIQDCSLPPCPTASIPGVWISPMISWIDLLGVPCAMVDYCIWLPNVQNENAWYEFMMANFERHYLGNRSPFGIYLDEWYLSAHPAISRALLRFLDVVNNLNDVFMVNIDDAIEWVKNPIPVNEYRQKPCKTVTPQPCPVTTCGPYRGEHNNREYFLKVCNECPRTYPWLGNPLGA